MRSFWFIGGSLALVLGVLGIFLPLLPTVPFLLLAAFCFSKSSETVHNWLINHKTLGPPIADWQEHGAIRKPAKIMASACIAAGLLISVTLQLEPWVLGLQAIVMSAVAVFIWTRPNG